MTGRWRWPARALPCRVALVSGALIAGVATLAGAAEVAAPAPAGGAHGLDTLAQRAMACTACHQPQDLVRPQGASLPAGYVPHIAGKPALYLLRQMQAFRDGRRPHEGMARLMETLDDHYLATLAAHFAALPAPYPPPAKPAVPAARQRAQALVHQGDPGRGLPACAACHGHTLAGDGRAIPGLLGLPRGYLVAQLGAWRVGVRHATTPDCMARISQRLADSDIAALADWLASQPALPALPALPVPTALPTRPAPRSGAAERANPKTAATLPMHCGSVDVP